MTKYPVQPYAGLIIQIVITVVAVCAMVGLVILPALNGTAPRAEHVSRITVGSIFLAIFLAAGVYQLLVIHAIHLYSDGTVRFARRLGSITMPATDVHVLIGQYRADYDGKLTRWSLEAITARGEIKVNTFHGAKDFASRMRKHNPQIRIEGLWPMTSP